MSTDMIGEPAVLLLGPEDEVTDPAELKKRRLTVVRCYVTERIGPCALQGCDGTILLLSVPVQNPQTGQRSLHRLLACTRSGCQSKAALMDRARVEEICREANYPWKQQPFN